MTTWPQEDHADLGLVEDDNTPDLRKKTSVPTDESATEVFESTTHEGADL